MVSASDRDDSMPGTKARRRMQDRWYRWTAALAGPALLLLASCSLLEPLPEEPGPRIYGIVTDTDSAALAGVTVTTIRGGHRTTTDSLGRFRLDKLEHDTFDLVFALAEYVTDTLRGIVLTEEKPGAKCRVALTYRPSGNARAVAGRSFPPMAGAVSFPDVPAAADRGPAGSCVCAGTTGAFSGGGQNQPYLLRVSRSGRDLWTEGG